MRNMSKKLTSLLKDRSLENNVFAEVASWDYELEFGGGSCSDCCFRNWRKFCQEMPCHDELRLTCVSWHAVNVPENDVKTLLLNFNNSGGNSKDLARKKKAELFAFLEAGNSIDDWKKKKYIEANKIPGRG